MNDDENNSLDHAFPLGDGVAQTEADIVCPYCGEQVELVLDPGGGPVQRYVEDCEVCCRPWALEVCWDAEGVAIVHARTEHGDE